MGRIFRFIFAIFLPPLAVLDKGCGAIAITSVLTLVGWIPGIIAALYFGSVYQPRRPTVTVPAYGGQETPVYGDYPAKRKRQYIELADGEMAEIVDDDGAPFDNDFDDAKRSRRY